MTIEQPTSSWAMKLLPMLSPVVGWRMSRTTTWMCFFGYKLFKPTHLFGNWSALGQLRRCLKKKERRRFQRKFDKHAKAGGKPYWQKRPKKNGERGWQGTKLLAETATYTDSCCQTLLAAWLKELRGLSILADCD